MMCIVGILLGQISICKAVADGPVCPVLARPTFSHGKNKILFYTTQVINKSARVSFGLAKLVIL